jgi:cupin fold WbuC family metalloprotein
MELIYSKNKPDQLLHIIHRMQEFDDMKKDFRKNIISPEEFIQLSVLKMKKGQTFEPHQHIWKKGEEKVIAQESWVVIKGSVKCSFYDINGNLLLEPILNVGDCSITLAGGHTYSILEDDTLVYEYKTGPYKGAIEDKVFINEI